MSRRLLISSGNRRRQRPDSLLVAYKPRGFLFPLTPSRDVRQIASCIKIKSKGGLRWRIACRSVSQRPMQRCHWLVSVLAAVEREVERGEPPLDQQD